MDLDLDVERAYALDAAARISGASERQIEYWADTGLVAPSIDRRLSAGRRVRLWGFVDLVELTVVAQLKGRGASLQAIRGLVQHIQDQQEADRPLSQVRFAVDRDSGELFWTDDQGNTSGGKKPSQLVLRDAIDLEEIRHSIRRAPIRSAEDIGRLDQRRGRMGNKPVLAGTRTPLSALAPYFERGYPDARILESFPHLSREDLDVARETLSHAS